MRTSGAGVRAASRGGPVLGSLLVAVLVVVLVAVPTAAASTRSSIALVLDQPGDVPATAGSTIMAGRVLAPRGRRAGHVVLLERYVGAGRWQSATRPVRTAADGGFRARVALPGYGHWSYRARVAATARTVAAVSRTGRLTVLRSCTVTMDPYRAVAGRGTLTTLTGRVTPAAPRGQVQLLRHSVGGPPLVEASAPVGADGTFSLSERMLVTGVHDLDLRLVPGDDYTDVAGPAPRVRLDVVDLAPPGGVRTTPVPLLRHLDAFETSISADARVVASLGWDNGWQVQVSDQSTGRSGFPVTGLDGARPSAETRMPAVSADGRFVAFSSTATNLVPDDTNGSSDVFVLDRETGRLDRVSPLPDGSQAVGSSRAPSISGEGRFVAYSTRTANLDPGDTTHWSVVVTDRSTGSTRTIFTERDSWADSQVSERPVISADGSVVSFASGAPDVVPGDDDEATDIFLVDRETGAVQRVPAYLEYSGTLTPWSLSADGGQVAFQAPSDRVPGAGDGEGARAVFVFDRSTGSTQQVSVREPGTYGRHGDSTLPRISADGRYVAFRASGMLVRGDLNDKADVVVRDRVAGTTRVLTVAGSGDQADADSDLPYLSADGHTIVYASSATNLTPEHIAGFFTAQW